MIARLLAAALLASAAASPPAALHLDPFYTQYRNAAGIPVVSSARTQPEALDTAAAIVTDMLSHRPDLAREMVRQGYRVAVMAPEETTLDLPEQADWKKPAPDDARLTRCERKHYDERIGRYTDRQYWDARARGMGGLLTSAATENLLAGANDRYHGQNIFVHEFSHDIFRASYTADLPLYTRIHAAYAAAMKAGRWQGEYASTTAEEYWAVGTQFWFNSAPVARFDGRTVLSDADLSAYDPPLAAVLRQVYGDRHHLAADRFWQHPDRVPPGPLPRFTAEVC
ncbi:hypothetical protein SAMN05192583_1306 [Sphingomonas gellani]|uniref:Glycoside hydrolase n=1 Tax=Sphingomonas gellani TaxID=1166340 RepID=A0A1H8BF38_9SPHN|nr:glycoside hydrolase [Sphingomonas gellani]SEM80477.1 hypothetical protein SAMN05192583_1306 [Sphingomonas gellani]